MKKNYLFIAAIATLTFASCTDDQFVGDTSPTAAQEGSEVINFGFSVQNRTRGDIAGNAAATLLGGNFYVMGTKGTEAATSPTPTLVFDNYLVHYDENTAGKTESNTANWEYVGVTPGTAPTANYVKLSDLNRQTIKYWDYSTSQYDFFAFSTGSKAAVSSTTPSDEQIGVTKMLYGASLASNATAYTFYIPTVSALQDVYITDITEVEKTSYGKEVTLKFKNLGSKVRIALYETVPGYSVKDVVFYAVDGTNSFAVTKDGTARLISADANGLPGKGSIAVSFPHVGDNNDTKQDYNKAVATVTPTTANSYKVQTFGDLTAQLVGKEYDEATGNSYLGRSLNTATFAGSSAAGFYQTVFPVSTPSPLTLRVDYTLLSTDGSGEMINVYGAKAVIPATYTKWLPNYAYTYIFKISDNTNGWTDPTGTEPAGLFPITFDAVVAEATDATAEQATITTVATPSITTYQQNHDITKDEYSKATAKDIYVQVMDNSAVPSALKTDLNDDAPGSTKRSLLYAITGSTPISEATVLDALEHQSSNTAGTIVGRNGLTLTPQTVDATVTSIVNGADDQPIAVTAGQAAKIAISLSAGNYAYVYDYSTSAKTNTTIYQPVTKAVDETIETGVKYVTTTVLDAIDTETPANVTAANEAVDDDYIYFSKTTNGTGTVTYSFVSVDGKSTLPARLVKCPVSSLLSGDGSTTTVTTGTFVFDTYVKNDGKYAVKVIKIVA